MNSSFASNSVHLAKLGGQLPSIDIEKADGIYLYDEKGNEYIDIIAGIAVNNLGHNHTSIIASIKKQVEKNLHVMVFGEAIQKSQIQLSNLLCSHLPSSLDNVYIVNSGSEAIEGTLKLARRYTGRKEILSFQNAYHGSTYGALSIMGSTKYQIGFEPLVPEVDFLQINDTDDLNKISEKTACVIIEPIQGEAGVVSAEVEYMQMLRKKCDEHGVLLAFDEVQTGMGRTGSLFAFEQYRVVPDILVLAKALGGGMPIGAFVASKKIMDSFQSNPPLGHITTFGGHPVSCSAAIACLNVLTSSDIVSSVSSKGELFKQLLNHSAIKEVRGVGLMLAIEFSSAEFTQQVIDNCLKNGVLTDWFLFAENCIRICPPLIITEEQIKDACSRIILSINQATNN